MAGFSFTLPQSTGYFARDNERRLFPKGFGSTFVKQYDINQASLDADESEGSAIATFTASRGASNPATYIDANGVIQQTTTSDTPRWTQGYYDSNGFSAAAGLLLEGASTNYLKTSIFDSDGNSDGVADNWGSPIAGVTATLEDASALTGISGAQIQKIVLDGTQGNFYSVAQIYTPSQSTTYTFSVWIKATAWHQTVGHKLIEIQLTNTGANTYEVINYAAEDDPITFGWRRYSITFTTQVDTNFLEFRLAREAGASGTGTIEYFQPQLNQAAYPSSPIPTTTAALTRNAETFTYPVANNFVGGTDGSICLVYRPIMLPDEVSSADKQVFSVDIDGGSNVWRVKTNSAANDKMDFHIAATAGNAQASTGAEPFSSVRYSLHSLIGTYSTTAASGDKLVMYLDGTDVGSSGTYNVPAGALPANIQIQNDSNQAMILVGIALFNKRLTAGEALQVHNLLT